MCKPSTNIPHAMQQQAADLDMFVCPFTVLQDTREQAPWHFSEIVIERRLWVIQRRVATLATGDYTIDGCEDRLCIERKSAADLVGSVTAGNARFRREHERMADIVKFGGKSGGFACVIVEGSLSAICDELDSEAGRRVTGDMIIGAAASWPMRYQVPWFFAGDRRLAELLAFRIMAKWWGAESWLNQSAPRKRSTLVAS
jgi:ERCC4-type nuclease